MLGRDGLQIFIICFQTIHIDNLIDGEDGEQKRQNDTYPGIDLVSKVTNILRKQVESSLKYVDI